ncbi:MAG: hypothetical protein ACRD1V_16300 [Vicinamibacterales bacterium]
MRTAIPPLKVLIQRLGAYVQGYGEKASVVVGTEQYEQDETTGSAVGDFRTLVAEFAIVRDPTLNQWLGFRDVIQVDGRPVTDHENRLVTILTSHSGGLSEARALSDEGARFNIGPVYRNFNVPTTALFFFKPENLDRFKFSRLGVAADGSIEIAFREKDKPTLIRTADGRSVPSEGSIWVDPASGIIRRTRLRLGLKEVVKETFGPRSDGSAEIDVSYAPSDRLGMWLPQSMREAYDVINDGSLERVAGQADYSNYRKFETTVRIK